MTTLYTAIPYAIAALLLISWVVDCWHDDTRRRDYSGLTKGNDTP